ATGPEMRCRHENRKTDHNDHEFRQRHAMLCSAGYKEKRQVPEGPGYSQTDTCRQRRASLEKAWQCEPAPTELFVQWTAERQNSKDKLRGKVAWRKPGQPAGEQPNQHGRKGEAKWGE